VANFVKFGPQMAMNDMV